MYATNAVTMTKYLAELERGGDFVDIPMRDDVRFTGPLASSRSATDYREICRNFAQAVRGLSLRAMVGDDEVIHVIYDVDLRLRGGPLATAQTVQFVDGAIASVDVIFDAAAITGVAS